MAEQRKALLRKRRPMASAMNLAKWSLSSVSLRSSNTLSNVVDTSALQEPTAMIPMERQASEMICKRFDRWSEERPLRAYLHGWIAFAQCVADQFYNVLTVRASVSEAQAKKTREWCTRRGMKGCLPDDGTDTERCIFMRDIITEQSQCRITIILDTTIDDTTGKERSSLHVVIETVKVLVD